MKYLLALTLVAPLLLSSSRAGTEVESRHHKVVHHHHKKHTDFWDDFESTFTGVGADLEEGFTGHRTFDK